VKCLRARTAKADLKVRFSSENLKPGLRNSFVTDSRRETGRKRRSPHRQLANNEFYSTSSLAFETKKTSSQGVTVAPVTNLKSYETVSLSLPIHIQKAFRAR